MRFILLFMATTITLSCKSLELGSQVATTKDGKSVITVEGDDADEFFDIIDVTSERAFEDEDGEYIVSKKLFATQDGKFNIACELGTKTKSCIFSFSGSVAKNIIDEKHVYEMVLADQTAQDFYDILDVQEFGTEAIQPPVFEKVFEASTGDFMVKCMLTNGKKECSLRKNAGNQRLSFLFFH